MQGLPEDSVQMDTLHFYLDHKSGPGTKWQIPPKTTLMRAIM